MHKTYSGEVLWLLLSLMVFLSGCSSGTPVAVKDLAWNVSVVKSEIKDALQSVETVTQYNGTKTNVEHNQAPNSGNVFLLVNLNIRKTGSQADSFEWKLLSVLDQAGKTYARHENDTFLEQYDYSPRLTGLVIRFGEDEGWVCFEIPAAAAKGQLTLTYQGSASQQQITLRP